ncbi:MAG: hypothetical protein HY913_16630 [Desulfomonile tiedjei]|nr:hypothetical protein [Desulfomonile tiedjei]
MTLLEDIQSAAVDAKSDLGTLLRKCKLLGARLGSQPLEDWLVWESNGYPDHVTVPDYRVWSLQVKGTFVGPLGSGLKTLPVPLACIPERSREHFQRYECRQSIAFVEAMLAKVGDGRIKVDTGDLALTLGEDVYEHQNCIEAWAIFPTGQLVELLNAVRNRILDFALAVLKEAPEAGELASTAPTTLEEARVTQIFNTIVNGGSANLVGTSNSSKIVFNVATGDFSSLECVLLENGVLEEDTEELRMALESEKTMKEGFGPKVSGWIGKMMSKAAEGVWNIGLEAAGKLLRETITKYYGL